MNDYDSRLNQKRNISGVEIDDVRERYTNPVDFATRQNLPKYRTLSGEKFAYEIAAHKPDLVIDLGCGANYFKPIVRNVIGVDLTHLPQVDLQRDVNTLPDIFKPNVADFVFCFGPWSVYELDAPEDWEYNRRVIKVIKYLLKKNGTAILHANSKRTIWNEENITMLGDEVGFKTQIDGIGITDTRLMTKDHWRIQEQVPEHRESIGMCQDGEDLIKNPRYVWRWTHI